MTDEREDTMGAETAEKSIEEMTVLELQSELAQRGVEYPRDARQPALRELVEEARTATPEDDLEEVEGEVVEDAEVIAPEEVEEAEQRALVLREQAPAAVSLIPSAAEFTAMQEIAERIASTQMVPTAYRGKPDDVIAAILTGREMGLGPMQSLREIHVIEGKPSLAANLLLGRMREGGIKLLESSSTKERAWIRAQRRDTGEIAEVEWTYEEAALITSKGKRLVDKDNWKNYPADMLWARAVGRLARRLGSDLIGSAMPYASEEVEDWDDPSRVPGGGRYPTHRSGGAHDWKSLAERLATQLGAEESVAWVAEIRDRLYQVPKFTDLPAAGQQHAFSRLVAIEEEIAKSGEDAQIRPDARDYVAGLFKRHFDFDLDGPPWSLSPSEADARPSRADYLAEHKGDAPAEQEADGDAPGGGSGFVEPDDIPFGEDAHEGYGS